MQHFNYHGHTRRCGHADGSMTDEDFVKEFINAGFSEIAFTDHMPQKNKIDTRQRMRMEYEEKECYYKSVQELKEKYKNEINIKVGFEVEYLPEHLEELKQLKKETDMLVLGQHYVYDKNGKDLKIFRRDKKYEFSDDDLITYARLIEEAVNYNLVKVIVHPDIFLLSRDNFGRIEEKVTRMICKIALKHNVVLEINLTEIFMYLSGKLEKITYPSKEFWKIVSEYNTPVIYGVDAHFRGQIRMYKETLKYVNEYLGKEIISKLNFVDKLNLL